MGIYERDYYRDDRRRMLDAVIPEGGFCKFLIVAMVGAFVLQWSERPDSAVVDRFSLSLEGILNGHIWQFLTFSFFSPSLGLIALIFSLVFIWWLGSDLEQLYGSLEFLCLYFATTLAAGAVFLGWSFFRDTPELPLRGAMGPITAITVLFAWHFPNHTIRLFMVLPVPMWLMAVVQIVSAVYFGREQFSYILAAAAFASLYYKKQWRLSSVFQGWSRRKTQQRSRGSLRVFDPEQDDDAEPVAVAAPNLSIAVLDEHLEAKVDAVLEKMARNGKESLSEKERQVLIRASEIYRRKRH